MEPAEIYHRTFLPDGSYGPVCNHSCHTPNQGPKPNLKFDPMPQFPSSTGPGGLQLLGPFAKPQPMVVPKREPYKPTQARHKVLQFTGKSLVPTFVVEKLDQDFAAYATHFERHFSSLMYRGRFQAVVDNLMVVGHVGRISGSRIYIPAGISVYTPMQELIERGVPVYVAAGDVAADSWVRYSASEVVYTVLTSIDGQVLIPLKTDYIGIEEADFWLLDAIFLGKGLADLSVAAGRRILRSLARRVSKRSGAYVFLGPTKEVAREALEAGLKDVGTPASFIPRSGMTPQHFHAFQEAARETRKIAIVRNTNLASTKLIQQGCPGKPFHLKFHTSPRTGVVTAETADEIKLAWEHGYYVVDADGIARRTILRNGKEVVEELPLRGTFWQVEKGQVIDPMVQKPVVGDYDLMGVMDPTAPGRNIALHVTRGEKLDNITSPIVEEFRGSVNSRLDMPRVLHGAQDQYAGFRGGATVFFPDGTVKELADEAAVRVFYESLARQTIKGQYPRPPAGVPVVDELAARRAAQR